MLSIQTTQIPLYSLTHKYSHCVGKVCCVSDVKINLLTHNRYLYTFEILDDESATPVNNVEIVAAACSCCLSARFADATILDF